ncbi:unnamed protein product [Nesidiocoris tenuis]|uniref:Uncharacterized protein n=1 Tax=Nesidiocoris tenuis TaxID=355587 RepID=A0A6H5H7B0_9HEMI|nr:unnamed protein product [Nesidiocoris tenuis]
MSSGIGGSSGSWEFPVLLVGTIVEAVYHSYFATSHVHDHLKSFSWLFRPQSTLLRCRFCGVRLAGGPVGHLAASAGPSSPNLRHSARVPERHQRPLRLVTPADGSNRRP